MALFTDEHRPSRSHVPLDRTTIMFLVVSVAVLGGTWWASGRVWSAADRAEPIINRIVADNGGPLTAHEWYEHDEARHIFDTTSPTDPSEPGVDGDVLYGPSLLLKTSLLLAGLMVVGICAMAMPRRWATPLLVLVFASAGLLIAPIIIYADTISAVTNIVE